MVLDETLAGRRKADEDIKAGRVHYFETAKEAIAFLHERAKEAGKLNRRNERRVNAYSTHLHYS